jgi:hypothetical protein
MSSNNGNGSSSLLEQVLQDCTPAQQARALNIARQTGLEDDDPSFVIPLATGKMQVLLEDAPERMGELLGQWRADVESAFQAEVAGVREAVRRRWFSRPRRRGGSWLRLIKRNRSSFAKR